jgi:hypothetical protein
LTRVREAVAERGSMGSFDKEFSRRLDDLIGIPRRPAVLPTPIN